MDFQLTVSMAHHAREGNIGDLKSTFEAEPKQTPYKGIQVNKSSNLAEQKQYGPSIPKRNIT